MGNHCPRDGDGEVLNLRDHVMNEAHASDEAGFGAWTAVDELRAPPEWAFRSSIEGMSLSELDSLKNLLSLMSANSSIRDSDRLQISDSDLVELAIQTWRLDKRVRGMNPEADKRAYKQFSDSVRRFNKLLQRFCVEYEDPTNKPFLTGWAEVEVVSWDEPDETPSPVKAGPWVKQVISPIVRRDDRMVKAAQVICVDAPDL